MIYPLDVQCPTCERIKGCWHLLSNEEFLYGIYHVERIEKARRLSDTEQSRMRPLEREIADASPAWRTA